MNRFEARAGVPIAPISADLPDWSREAKAFWHWHPSRSLLASLRAYEKLRGATRPDRVVTRWLVVLRHRFWSAVSGADIPLGCRIGGGLLLPHPNGVVVHPDARIGANCLLMQQVTLGTSGGSPGAPTLAGHVDIGAGAKVLGAVTLGAHTVVGANAVVLCDVPEGATAVGVPARILAPRALPIAAIEPEAAA